MPQKNFNKIETREYTVSSDELVVRKEVIHGGKSGEQIFAEAGVQARIIETMPADMRPIYGKMYPCFVYKIEATKMTDAELAEAERLMKVKADEDAAIILKTAAINREEAKKTVTSAPPPLMPDPNKVIPLS